MTNLFARVARCFYKKIPGRKTNVLKKTTRVKQNIMFFLRFYDLHRQKTVTSTVKFKKPIKKLSEIQYRHFILKNKKLLELDPLLSFL